MQQANPHPDPPFSIVGSWSKFREKKAQENKKWTIRRRPGYNFNKRKAKY